MSLTDCPQTVHRLGAYTVVFEHGFMVEKPRQEREEQKRNREAGDTRNNQHQTPKGAHRYFATSQHRREKYAKRATVKVNSKLEPRSFFLVAMFNARETLTYMIVAATNTQSAAVLQNSVTPTPTAHMVQDTFYNYARGS